MSTHFSFWVLAGMWLFAFCFLCFLVVLLLEGPQSARDTENIKRYKTTAALAHACSDADEDEAQAERHAWNHRSIENARRMARQEEEDDQRRLQDEWDEEHRDDCLTKPWEDHIHSWREGRR